MRFFARVKKKDDLDDCVAVLGAEDVRAEFDLAFRRFSQSLDMMLPDPKALGFVGDYKWLGKIRQAASARYRDKSLDISDCEPKVRALIEEAIIAEGVQILVKQVNLFTPEFEREDRRRSSRTTRRRARWSTPSRTRSTSASTRTRSSSSRSGRGSNRSSRTGRPRRIDAAEQLKLFASLEKEIKGHAEAAQRLGLTETAFAIYGLLQPEAAMPLKENPGVAYVKVSTMKPEPAKVELASLLEESLATADRHRRLGAEGRRAEGDAKAHQATAPRGRLRG